ncbi:MAG: hypothetical protein R3B70_38685 [Polyangiaceae bacterium]
MDLWELKRGHTRIPALWPVARPQPSAPPRWPAHALLRCAAREHRAARYPGGAAERTSTCESPARLPSCSAALLDPHKAKLERERLRLENSFYAGLTVLTYDDLIDRATSLLDFLLRHRNGSSSA